MRRLLWIGLLVGLAVGCDDEAVEDNPGQGGAADQGAAVDGGGGADEDMARADQGVPAGGICAPGETRCVDGMLRTCIDDATGWLVERCAADELCRDGACEALACAPGSRRCTADNAVEACAADGSAYGEPQACPAEATCLDGVCLAQLCDPGEQVCGEGVLLTCGADGLTWDRAPCAEGQICLDGACAEPPTGGGIDCAPGEVLCGANGRVVCSDDGARYVETPCPEGQACFQSACVECVRDRDCPDGGACVDGECGPPPLAVTTLALPAAQVGARYDAPLQAEHGTPPYHWAVEGDLPAGIALEGDTLTGAAEAAGESPLTLVVTDADGAEARADVVLRVVGEGLQITTERLPDGEEGEPYEVALGALGGEGRYGWFLVDGDLPPGMELRGDGVITGVPAGVGPFEFTVRVVDSSTPPLFAERDFTIQIEIAPLRIVADQLLELFVTRIVTLPVITVIRDIPVPYRAELQAAGGLRPYTWREVELPQGLRGFIPQSGIPEGLALGEDGVIQGAVVDPDQIVELAIPFTDIVLTGFFFFAEVSDSQDPPATQQAVFVLPTLPIGN